MSVESEQRLRVLQTDLINEMKKYNQASMCGTGF